MHGRALSLKSAVAAFDILHTLNFALCVALQKPQGVFFTFQKKGRRRAFLFISLSDTHRPHARAGDSQIEAHTRHAHIAVRTRHARIAVRTRQQNRGAHATRTYRRSRDTRILL